MEPKDILNRLKFAGWQKGGYGGHNTPNCIIGAAVVCRMNEEGLSWGAAAAGRHIFPMLNSIQTVISEQYPHFGRDIPAFNDASETKFEDVERVLEKAQLLVESDI